MERNASRAESADDGLGRRMAGKGNCAERDCLRDSIHRQRNNRPIRAYECPHLCGVQRKAISMLQVRKKCRPHERPNI